MHLEPGALSGSSAVEGCTRSRMWSLRIFPRYLDLVFIFGQLFFVVVTMLFFVFVFISIVFFTNPRLDVHVFWFLSLLIVFQNIRAGRRLMVADMGIVDPRHEELMNRYDPPALLTVQHWQVQHNWCAVC